MSEQSGRPFAGVAPPGRGGMQAYEPRQANLADILERVLDKGIVIAGDIQINLLDIELLTIKLRLVVASVDRAKEMGIDWWEHDPMLSTRAKHDQPKQISSSSSSSEDSGELEEENERLRQRIKELESGGS